MNNDSSTVPDVDPTATAAASAIAVEEDQLNQLKLVESRMIDGNLRLAEEYKDKGNAFFKEANYAEALKWYGKIPLIAKAYFVGNSPLGGDALSSDIKEAKQAREASKGNGNGASDEQAKLAKDLLTKGYHNLSATYEKMGKMDKAKEFMNKVLDYDPTNPKAVWKRGHAILVSGDYLGAQADIKLALAGLPKDINVRKDAKTIKDRIELDRQNYLAKQREMFGGKFTTPTKSTKSIAPDASEVLSTTSPPVESSTPAAPAPRSTKETERYAVDWC